MIACRKDSKSPEASTLRVARSVADPVSRFPNSKNTSQIVDAHAACFGIRVTNRKRKHAVWLLTNVEDPNRLSTTLASQFYRWRWESELDIRAIKVTMGMDQLRCLTPDMVCKEVWTCLLAYNLIRQKMLQAAMEKDISPRSMSFTNALQIVAAGWMVMPLLDQNTQQALIQIELGSVASRIVGNRPGRVEPRAVKRRPKDYRLLTMLREKARQLLRKGIDPYKKQK